MSAFGITVEYRVGTESGPDVLQRLGVAFERTGAELTDLGRHVFPRLAPVFETAMKRQFDAQGAGPVAGSWSALAEIYAAWKARKYPGKSILRRTDALYDGLTVASSPFAARDYSASTFLFGTQGVEYASFHQTGTSRMSPRPPFDLDPQFEDDLQVSVRRGINDAMRDAGLADMVGEIEEGG